MIAWSWTTELRRTVAAGPAPAATSAMSSLTSKLWTDAGRVIRAGAVLVAAGICFGCQSRPIDSGAGSGSVLLAPPLPEPRAHGGAAPGPFEQQFRVDTGQIALTRRTEFEQSRRVRGQSRDRLEFRFDLSRWPQELRPLARAWIAVGATNSFTTELTVTLTFTQDGTSMTTPLNNRISVDNVALMGCDFAVKDGPVILEIENAGMSRDLDYRLHTIIYVP